MSLQILEKNEIFYLNGEININTVNFFDSFFETVNHKKITLNIDKVILIDKKGLEVLFKFMQNIKKNNKIFVILGYGCKEIYDHFRQTNVA